MYLCQTIHGGGTEWEMTIFQERFFSLCLLIFVFVDIRVCRYLCLSIFVFGDICVC